FHVTGVQTCALPIYPIFLKAIIAILIVYFYSLLTLPNHQMSLVEYLHPYTKQSPSIIAYYLDNGEHNIIHFSSLSDILHAHKQRILFSKSPLLLLLAYTSASLISLTHRSLPQ